MNQKKCKALRQTIRRLFAHWPVRELTGAQSKPGTTVRIEVPQLQLDGTTLLTREFFQITPTLRNLNQTQRALYRRCKKNVNVAQAFAA